jgi:hypothetical protein
MNNWTDDELMAYADGELVGERRAALAAAMANDAEIRRRVNALEAQRQRVSAAFADVLEEPVPDRLTALLAAPGAARPVPTVADLAAQRQRRDARRAMPSWAQWGGMAASVALGIALGMQIGPGSPDALSGDAGGPMVATGRLAQALGSRLASDTSGSPDGIAVQLSFVDKGGRYCRTFSTDRMAGLACRDATQWTVLATAAAERAPSTTMRQAGSPLPRSVLEAVDARIEGTTLSAEQELRARDRAWIGAALKPAP